MFQRCGNRWETQLLVSLLTTQTQLIHKLQSSSKVFLRNLEPNKACCCDECCESVETTETPITHAAYGIGAKVVLCEYGGKRSSCRPGIRVFQNLVHSYQQNFRTFLKPSPQGAET
jgi:hypothetical protein